MKAKCKVCVGGVFVDGVCNKCQSKENSREQEVAEILKDVAK